MHSNSKLALIVENSLQSGESFTGPVVPDVTSSSDAVTVPSDEAMEQSVATTTGALVAALHDSSETRSRESASLGSASAKDKSQRRP
ncbi:hypothetical protein MTO96_026062 [Rhipicephalus appendiculatus]